LCDSYHCSADGILVAQSWRRRASQIVRYSGKPLMNRFKENNPDDVAFEQEVIDRHKNAGACETHHLHKMQWMGIASAFGLRSASYGGQVAPPILRANWIYLAKRQPAGVAVSTSGQTSSRPVT
jgi:hypothetical protein